MNAYMCKCLAKLPGIIDQLNGDGPAPGAVTIGGTIVYFEKPDERMVRHEEKHVDQAGRFAPWFLTWLPRRARAWAGARWYWREYIREHHRMGYEANRFEVEARAAE